MNCRSVLAVAGGAVSVLSLIGCAQADNNQDVSPAPVTESSSPMIVAHRAGTGDYPENTLLGIQGSLDDGAEGIWLSVQLSMDGIPVLYRPIDLAALTNGSGTIAETTSEQLAALNAGWSFQTADGIYPFRERPVPVPTLAAALEMIPRSTHVFLDLKQLPAEPLVDAVASTIGAEQSGRVTIYSTDATATNLASQKDGLDVAEARDVTRQRLVDIAVAHKCSPPPEEGTWVAFELHREVTVTEKFTLGEATTTTQADLWDEESVSCVDPTSRVNTLAIGVSTKSDFDQARRLGIDAVLVDSPAIAREWASQ